MTPKGRLKQFGLLYPEGSNRKIRCTILTFVTVPLQSRRRLLCISWPFRPKVQRAEKVNDKRGKGNRGGEEIQCIYQSRRNCGKPELNFAVGPPLNWFEPRGCHTDHLSSPAYLSFRNASWWNACDPLRMRLILNMIKRISVERTNC